MMHTMSAPSNVSVAAIVFVVAFVLLAGAAFATHRTGVGVAAITFAVAVTAGALVVGRGGRRVEGFDPSSKWIDMVADVVYCIVLNRRSARVQNVKEFFAGLHVDPVYVNAIDKNHDLNIDDLINDCDETGACKLMPKYTLSAGEVGCYLSHLKALRTFLDGKKRDGGPLQTCIICEDDVKPVGGEELPKVIQKLMTVAREAKDLDWDFINMGPCHSWCDARLRKSSILWDGKMSSAVCSHFIMVNRRGAERILANAFPIFNLPYDVKVNALARQGIINYFETSDIVVTQNRNSIKSELGHDNEMRHCEKVWPPRRKNLIFSSVGDNSRWYTENMWTGQDRTFDIIVAFYGSDANQMTISQMNSDRLISIKGSKFQNLYRCYNSWPQYFMQYEYIAVLDDDIQMSTPDINRMFELTKAMGLWISQPSFTPDSKVSHDITKNEPALKLAYTNFVEMNCPFFEAKRLFDVLNSPKNDGTMMGYGFDHLYMDILGSNAGNKFAVIHDVKCRNPHDAEKPDGREILKLASQDTRVRQWEKLAKRWNIDPAPSVKAASCVLSNDATPQTIPEYCGAAGTAKA
jgi:hypothetical protein